MLFGIFRKKEVKIGYGWYEVSKKGMLKLHAKHKEQHDRNRKAYFNLRDRHNNNQSRIMNTRAYKEMEAKHKTKIKQREDTIELLLNRIKNLKKEVR